LKPRIILAVGLPGSGKSTYFANLGAHAISSDAIRLQLADDETDQTIHARVFATMRYLLKQRVELGRPVTYVDATNLTRRDRRPFIRLAQKHGCDIEAVFFDIPLDVCRARNSSRSRLVPNEVLDRMAAKLVPPSVEEGFSVVTVMSGEVVRHLP
jgi:predicted kinase